MSGWRIGRRTAADRERVRRRRAGLVCIGPCHDPLALWFVEWGPPDSRCRRYVANRREARALARERAS